MLFAEKRGGIFGPGAGSRSVGGGGGGGSGGAGGGGGISGFNRLKSEGGLSRSMGGGGGGDEYSEPVYPEELEDGDEVAQRMDIEYINLISDDEDDVVVTGHARVARNKGKGRAPEGHAMRPIRLTRHEHKERVVLVNTDSSTDQPKAEEDEAGMGEEVTKTEEEEDEGLFVTQDGVAVKAERGAGVDIMDLDAPSASQREASIDLDAPSQPSQRQYSVDLDAPPPAAAPKLRKPLAAKDKKPVLQTEEDKAEYARHLEDVEILSKELGGMQTAEAGSRGDGDVEMGEDGQPVAREKAPEDSKEGRLYLFQFPPILPKLANAAAPVKADPADDADVVELADIPASAGTVDLTATPDVKAEPNAEEVDVAGGGAADTAADVLVREPGLIGKLVVRRSGKVELSWGGTSLALGRGAEFDFLTTGLVVQGLEAGRKGVVTKEEEGRMSGTGMGRIMGKFVATPDWEKLFG